ncbi:MAG TPA: tetratricopeptide repeat protein [Candidatus Binataceae bacterium]|nr:tetratricopeptide repeat protein [Candidatus Binataceae bacterium]
MAGKTDSHSGAKLVVRPGTERVWLIRILIVTALFYSRSLGNEFVLDDLPQIVLNRYIASWSFVWKSLVNNALWFVDPLHPPPVSYYRPLQNIWSALNFHLFGLNPIGWHAAMLALHLLVVVLVFRLASILTRSPFTGLLAAALFAWMPVHAEAVVWPAAVATPLSAAFELAAFEFYLRSRGGGANNHSRPGLAISLGLFAGALLSYDKAIEFPALIAAYAYIFPRELVGENRAVEKAAAAPISTRGSAALIAAWPYVLVTVAYITLRYWVLGFVFHSNLGSDLTAREAVLTVPAAITRYVALLVFPWMADPAHPLDFAGSVAQAEFLLPATALTALFISGFFLFRAHRHRRLYLFCAAWMLITLGPILKLDALFPLAAIQDRYLYLPSFGFCVIAADIAAGFVAEGERTARIAWVATAAVGIFYGWNLFSVQQYWHDEVALIRRHVQKSPEAAAYHGGLGMALVARGQYADARTELEIAKKLSPGDTENLYDLALVEERLGDSRAAAEEMNAWLEHIKSPSPDAYAKAALFADAAGDTTGANAALARAAAIPGGAEVATVTRAQVLLRHGDSKTAERELRKVLDRHPLNVAALGALGALLSDNRHYDEALDVLQRAASISPEDPNLHYQLATTLYQLGRNPEAQAECAVALSRAPYDPNARALMAQIERGGAPH